MQLEVLNTIVVIQIIPIKGRLFLKQVKDRAKPHWSAPHRYSFTKTSRKFMFRREEGILEYRHSGILGSRKASRWEISMANMLKVNKSIKFQRLVMKLFNPENSNRHITF